MWLQWCPCNQCTCHLQLQYVIPSYPEWLGWVCNWCCDVPQFSLYQSLYSHQEIPSWGCRVPDLLHPTCSILIPSCWSHSMPRLRMSLKYHSEWSSGISRSWLFHQMYKHSYSLHFQCFTTSFSNGIPLRPLMYCPHLMTILIGLKTLDNWQQCRWGKQRKRRLM